MLADQNKSEFLSNSAWTIEDFNTRPKIVRKFVNSAIYVEKEVPEIRLHRKTSSLTSCIANDDMSLTEINDKKLQENNCKGMKKSPESGYRTTEPSSNSSKENSEDSYIREIKQSDVTNLQSIGSELRLSLSCLSTNRTCTLDPKERQEIVQHWMTRKGIEQKRKDMLRIAETKRKEKEREQLLENERANFTRWLAEKKREEERKKAMEELKAQEEKLKQVEREKKRVENDITYNLWLRRKRKGDLERKITEKLTLLNLYEDKQRRLEENEKAYKDWLENSKNKPKPIPLNKGLRSLCSSSSVTYINPVPWKANIDDKNHI